MADYIAKVSTNGETLAGYNHGAAGPVNVMDGDRIIASTAPPSIEAVTPSGNMAVQPQVLPTSPATVVHWTPLPTTADSSPQDMASDDTPSAGEPQPQLSPAEKDRLDVEDFKKWRDARRASAESRRPSAYPPQQVAPISGDSAESRMELAQFFEQQVRLHEASLRGLCGVPAEPQSQASTTPGVTGGLSDLAALGLDFLGFADAKRAKVPVVFKGSMGIMTVPYHAVVVTSKIVALVYDTRYDQGVQFLPAATKEKLEVDIPSQNTGPMACASLDISWSLGCMDIAVLIRE